MTLWTVGHSDRSTAELVELLRAHGVERLVDVRRYPGSRRHPHFARSALAASLRAAGIAYLHRETLGGHRAPRADAPHDNGAWRQDAFRAYADHMASGEFRAALAELVALAAERRTAVMCAEADPEHCHRRLLSDALVAAGHEVLHAGTRRGEPTTTPRRHALDPRARRLADGGLHYPAEGGQGHLFA